MAVTFPKYYHETMAMRALVSNRQQKFRSFHNFFVPSFARSISQQLPHSSVSLADRRMRGLCTARRGALRARCVLRVAARHDPPAAARPGAARDAEPAARARRPARSQPRRPIAVRAISACAIARALRLRCILRYFSAVVQV